MLEWARETASINIWYLDLRTPDKTFQTSCYRRLVNEFSLAEGFSMVNPNTSYVASPLALHIRTRHTMQKGRPPKSWAFSWRSRIPVDQFRLKRTVTMKNIVRHIKTGCPPTNHSDLFRPIFHPHAMRFSSAIFVTVVAALALSISATPTDAGIQHCPAFCVHSRKCATCTRQKCVSFSCLCLESNHITHWHERSSFYAWWVRVMFLHSHRWIWSTALTRELLVIQVGWSIFWSLKNLTAVRAMEILKWVTHLRLVLNSHQLVCKPHCKSVHFIYARMYTGFEVSNFIVFPPKGGSVICEVPQSNDDYGSFDHS
jgi:hypothetical protein